MKKLSILLIVFIVILTSFCVNAQAQVNSKQEEAVKLIVDMELMTLSEYSIDAAVQRRDLAEVVAKCMNVSEYNHEGQVFADVSEDDSKAKYIYAAYKAGVMNGYFDGTFKPFRAVSYNEAIKVAVTLAGYEEYAQGNGGYPMGYITTAMKLKIDKGIRLGGDDAIALGEFCLLIKQTLEADMMDTVAIVNSEAVYESISGQSILTHYMDMKAIKGQVKANYLTTLTGESSLNLNEVKIGNNIYATLVDDIKAMLGKYLVCYVREIDGKETIVAYYEYKNSVEKFFYAEDIVSASNSTITYYDTDGKKNSVRILDNADFIYNGVAKISWSPSEINVKGSEIRFLDSEGDGKYDIIFVNRFVNLLVKSYVKLDETIYFHTSKNDYKAIDLSEDSDNRYELVDAGGEEILPEELVENNIISVAQSVNKKVYIMRLGKGIVTGKCTAIGEDNINVEETEYELGIIDDSFYMGSIELNKKGDFYLDFRDRIVGVSYDGHTATNYAYLMKIGETSGISKKIELKLFDDDGKFYIYQLADKVVINGTKKNGRDILSSYQFMSGGKASDQLITYELNSKNEIETINSAMNGSIYTTDEERDTVFTLDDSLSSVICRKGNMNLLASRYFMTTDTKFFVIPNNMDDEDNFYILDLANMKNDASYYNVKLYDVDPNSRISAAVIDYDTEMFEGNSGLIGVVMKTAIAFDADRNAQSKITLHRGGTNPENVLCDEAELVEIKSSAIVDLSLVDYTTVNGINYTTSNKLKKGDIIEYVKDKNGKVVAMYLLYRAGTETLKESSLLSITKDNFYSMESYCFAEVTKLLDGAIRVKVPSQDGKEMWERVFPVLKSTLLLQFKNGEMEELSLESLTPEDKVFIYVQTSTVKIIIKY